MTQHKFYLVLLLIILCSNLFSQEQSKSFDSLKSELQKFIEKEIKTTKTIGLSIGIIDNQELIWADGFGYSDKENNIKANAQTIYRVGSVSKLFTATSVMQQVENGKILLDQPIQTYIPEFQIKSRLENPGIITTRNILTHHSGIPSDIMYQFYNENPEPYINIISHLNNEYICNKTNFIHSYSNCGYTLLGILTEKVSGENFYDYTEKHLFEPLEMKNSAFRLNENMKQLYSKGYKGKKVFDEPLLRDVPAGMLHTNVEDMSNFVKMIFNDGNFNGKQILKPETLKEMLSRQNMNVPLDMSFQMGLCWMLNKSDFKYAGLYAEHGGDTFIYHAMLSVLPEHKIGVIVMLNTSSGIGSTHKIANHILTKYLEFKTGIKPPEKIKTETSVNLSKNNFKQHEGFYALGGSIIEIKAKNNNKMYFKQNMAKVIMTYNNHEVFNLKAIVLGIIPIKIKKQCLKFAEIDGQKYLQVIIQNSDTITAGIKTEKKDIADVWRKRIGEYIAVNDTSNFKLFTDFKLLEKDGFILIGSKIFGDTDMYLALKILSDNEAVIEGIGRNTGNTVYFENDQMIYTGFVLKKKAVK